MDEPLSNLDAKLRVQMRSEISKLHQRLQTTFIYVTHDQTEALTMGTRIVVMKDGVIQHVDTPTALYAQPQNMFVAGFIGSPQMNFFEVDIVKQNDNVTIKNGDINIKLPEGKAKAFLATGYDKDKAILGIRPEYIHDDQMFLSSVEHEVPAHVEITEPLGAETYLHLLINNQHCVARVDPRTTAKHNMDIRVAFELNKIHLFDPDTEKTIIN
jgi:multiple sugar transport system ATP-binding protein